MRGRGEGRKVGGATGDGVKPHLVFFARTSTGQGASFFFELQTCITRRRKELETLLDATDI